MATPPPGQSDIRSFQPRLLLLKRLLSEVRIYHQLTGHHLPIYGEIGELYAELRYGISRHKPYAQGSDGRLGNAFVEIKTIGPASKNHVIRVRRSGNFGKLVVVKIDADFNVDSRIVDRSVLRKGKGKFASLSWKTALQAPGNSRRA